MTDHIGRIVSDERHHRKDRLVKFQAVELVGGPCHGERAEIEEHFLSMWRRNRDHYYLYSRLDSEERKMYWANEKKTTRQLIRLVQDQARNATHVGEKGEVLVHTDSVPQESE